MCKVNSPLYGQQKLSARSGQGPGEAHWVPNTDVFALEDKLVIQVELSGMRRSDVDLIVEGNRLLIRGQRPDGVRSASKCKFLVMEISYGPFECVFEIPEGYDMSHAQAAYQNGFLRVDVPCVASSPQRSARTPVAELK